MRRLGTLIILFSVVLTAQAQDVISQFFSPIPLPADLSPLADQPVTKFDVRPLVTIPALKVTQSLRPDAVLDAEMLTSVGGGVSAQWLEIKGGAWYSNASVNLIVLLDGDTQKKAVDLSAGLAVGVFDNLIMLGGGYDFGVVEQRSRWFGMLSLGINFNNKLVAQ